MTKKEYVPIKVRTKDLEQAIHKPDKHKVALEEETRGTDTTVFTSMGKEDEVDGDGNPLLWDGNYKGRVVDAENRPEAYAKRVRAGRSHKYFVKKGGDGKFYNPLGLYEETRYATKRVGLDIYKFKEVPFKAFVLYLKFLKTKNRAWLQNAEREVF
jgi:hypothetical protein